MKLTNKLKHYARSNTMNLMFKYHQQHNDFVTKNKALTGTNPTINISQVQNFACDIIQSKYNYKKDAENPFKILPIHEDEWNVLVMNLITKFFS